MKSNTNGKSFAKKIVVFALLITALSGAVYLNFRYTDPSGSFAVNGSADTSQTSTQKYLGDAKYVNAQVKTTANNENDYFQSTREKREADRKESINTLNDVLSNVKSTEDAKEKAVNEITRLTKISEQEQSVENLIIAKGFADCVVVIGEKNISAVVKCNKDGLLDSETRQIQDIITSNSEFSLENIKIIEIK